MPTSKKEELLYAFLTVLITVPCFVVYCLSIENGGILKIDPMFALKLIPIEFTLAYLTEIFIGSKLATKIAFHAVSPKEYQPKIIEIAIICSTVCVMCPLMSFYATILYKGIFPAFVFHQKGLTIGTFLIQLIPNFLQTVVLNFPFALFGQLFLIQPLVRCIFKKVIKKESR